MSFRRHSSSRAALWGGILLLGAAACLTASASSERLAALSAFASYLLCWALMAGPLRLGQLSPALVYLHVLAVFHLGLVAPWALHADWVRTPLWLARLELVEPLFLVQLAILGLFAGAAFASAASDPATPRRAYLEHNIGLCHCGLAVIGVGLASLLWGARSFGWERLLAASYFDTYSLVQEYDPRFFITSLQVTPMGFYLFLAAAPRRWVMPGLAAGLAWTLAVFAFGYRGYALTPALTAVVLLHLRGVRLPRPALSLACAALLIAIPAGRAFRAERLADRMTSGWSFNAGPVAAFEEMGGSLRPLAHTVELLAGESYRGGRTYLLALREMIPNVSSEWSGGAYIPLEDLPPSHWVTRLAAPWTYSRHGGLGFSAVAEAYMNFGRVGPLAVFALLGALLAWAERFARGRPTRLALWAVVFGPLIWNVRNSAAVFARPAIWGVALVLAARLAADTISAARRRPSRPGKSRALPPAGIEPAT